MSRKNYYAILGIHRDASAAEIKQAYRRLTLETHPDRWPDDPDAMRRFQEVSEAYDVLGDVARRARYDRESLLPSALDLSRPPDLQTARDVLHSVFGDVFGERRQARRRGRDIRYTLTVDLREAVLGSAHEIEFDSFVPCDVCSGSGVEPGGRPAHTCDVCQGKGEVKGGGLFSRRERCGRCDGTGYVHVSPCQPCRGRGTEQRRRKYTVRLSPATKSGAERVVEGQGEPGRFGGDAGDLRVTINVRPHLRLSLRGRDVVSRLPISISQAAMGAKVDIETIDGVVAVRVPAGTASHTQLRLRGRGGSDASGTRGDHLVTVEVETPRSIDRELESVLERLETLCSTADRLPRRFAARRAVADAGGDTADDGNSSVA